MEEELEIPTVIAQTLLIVLFTTLLSDWTTISNITSASVIPIKHMDNVPTRYLASK